MTTFDPAPDGWVPPHPLPNVATCGHAADEWCDGCFMAPWHRYVLSLLDADAERPDPTAEARHREALRLEYMAGVHGVCVNRQHDHGQVARKASCARPLAPHPPVARAVGAVAYGALFAAGCAVVAGYAAREWLTTDGRLRLELARQRAADRWCAWLG